MFQLCKVGHPHLNTKDFRTIYTFKINFDQKFTCFQIRTHPGDGDNESTNQIWKESDKNYNFYCLSTKKGNGQTDRQNIMLYPLPLLVTGG